MGKKLTVGENDLATTHPDLASEWDFERNAPLTPKTVFAGANQKYFWLCSNGHSYSATGAHRLAGRQCPFCSGTKVLAGFNDLATTHPDLAAEWDFERNAPLTPQEVSAGANQKYFWICPEQHSYEAVSNDRKRGNGCPYCSGRRVFTGFNDLATTHPDIALEWDFERNTPLTPQEVSAGQHTKAFWLCLNGHSYETSVNAKRGGAGCPYCSGQKVLIGFNDLATTHPDLALEWDFERNAPLTPQGVSSGSNRKFFWHCPEGHSYTSVPVKRAKGTGCPYCVGKAVLVGFNDLATTHPDLASEWDFERNAPLTPSTVVAGTPRTFWWRCSMGHEYRALASNRKKGSGCPKCAKYGFDPTQEGLLYFIRNDELKARKIGITNTNRTFNRVSGFGSGWSVVSTFTNESGLFIREVETALFYWLRKELGLPTFLGKEDLGGIGGHTETFSMEGPSDAEVIQKINETFALLSERTV